MFFCLFGQIQEDRDHATTLHASDLMYSTMCMPACLTEREAKKKEGNFSLHILKWLDDTHIILKQVQVLGLNTLKMTTRNKKTSLENTDGMVTQTGIPLLYRMVPERSILNED